MSEAMRNLQEYEYEYAEFIYYTPGNLDREGQLWPVRAGRSLAKPNYRVGPKRIECYSLHFVYEGRVGLNYGDQHIELQKGDLFCLFPDQTYHYYIIPAEAPLQMNWLALDGSRVMPLLKLAGLVPEQPAAPGKVTSRVQAALERILGAMTRYEQWDPAVSLELEGQICELLAGLMPEAFPKVSPSPSGWVSQCMEFMNLHATEGITVQQVASLAGVHRSYFTSAFTSQVGVSPQKYIQSIRMGKAKRLLAETEATITEIALSLGYPNLYTFTRAFKSYYKSSPLHTRTAGDG
ncbi:AraC family transcriptional regulator [Paenibacillus tritici]|jgi:AraC-like DNA-binding protein|uniref:AraC family transcriptional regulator n=1 Tax=Paenibacillus tritici TaxID=1873425 RepID=UPI0031BA6DBE